MSQNQGPLDARGADIDELTIINIGEFLGTLQNGEHRGDSKGSWRAAKVKFPGRGTWTIEEVIKDTSVGAVCRVKDNKGTLYAVKFCYDAERAARLKNELAQTQLLIKKLPPGIADQIVAATEWNLPDKDAPAGAAVPPPYFLVYPWYPEGTLNHWLDEQRKAGTVEVAEVARLVADAAQVIAAIHEAGVLHNDIKPANILMAKAKDGSVRPCIADFGIGELRDPDSLRQVDITQTYVQLISKSESSPALRGTVAYMAPELFGGTGSKVAPVTEKTDVFSLGVVLYGAVTEDWDRPPPRKLHRKVRLPGLRDVIERATDDDPNERIATAREFAERLANWDATEREVEELRAKEERAKTEAQRERDLRLLRRVVAVFMTVLMIFLAYGNINERRLRERAEAAEQQATKLAEFNEGLADANSILADEERTARKASERNAYLAAVIGAAAAIQDGEWNKARMLLAQAPKEHRNWEWGYFSALCDNSLSLGKVADMTNGRGYTDEWVVSVAGEMLVTRTSQGGLSGLDLVSGTVCWYWHDGKYGANRVSVTNARAVVVTANGFVYLIDTSNGQQVATWNRYAELALDASISEDGSVVVIGLQDCTARVVDAHTGQELRQFDGHAAPVYQVWISIDGTRALTHSIDDTAQVWNLADATAVCTLQTKKYREYPLAINPRGTQVLMGSWSGEMTLHDISPGKTSVKLVGHTGPVIDVAFNADGTRMVTGSRDTTLRVWELTKWPKSVVLRGFNNPVGGVRWTSDDARILAASIRGEWGVWDSLTGKDVLPMQSLIDSEERAFFDASGVGIMRIGAVAIFDACSGKTSAWIDSRAQSGRTSVKGPGGTRELRWGYDRPCELVNASTGERIAAFSGPDSETAQGAISSDGSRVVTALRDDTLRLWVADTGTEIGILHKEEFTVEVLQFSNDGSRLFLEPGPGYFRVLDSVPWRDRFKELQARGLRK